jgi:hypothetical protein
MRIKNWKKFQHFKDRRPPWIKLHREILEQRDINAISDKSFRVLVLLWLLASEDEDKNGNLPEMEDIAFRLRMKEKEITQSLQELGAWIDYSDIKEISDRYQDVPTETEAETEKRQTWGEFKNIHLTEENHKKLIDKFSLKTDDLIEEMSAYIAQSGKRYKNHYAALINWGKRKGYDEKPESEFDFVED